MRFIIKPYSTPSGNEFMYSTWHKYAKHKAEIADILARTYGSSLARAGDGHEDRRMKVVFTVYRTRLLDDDNLLTGLKAFRDCLTRMGFIKDDSRKWADFEYHQHTKKNSPLANAKGEPCCGVIVEITPATSEHP